MTPEEVQSLIDQSIAVAINKHNRNASMISMVLGFSFMGAFVDGLFRILGIVPPFMGLDISIIPEIAKQWQV
tara:strand:+ start:233 stop:448 length:216 start_codon:yes stop_codon:yes gene_type:complete